MNAPAVLLVAVLLGIGVGLAVLFVVGPLIALAKAALMLIGAATVLRWIFKEMRDGSARDVS